MARVRSPGAAVIWAFWAGLGAAGLVLALCLTFPVFGMKVTPDGGMMKVRTASGQVVHLKDSAPIVFSSKAGRLSVPAAELAPDFEPTGAGDAVSAWFAERGRLLDILHAPDARAQLPDGTTVELKARRHGLFSLSSDVWLLCAQAVLIGLLGVWLILMRPRDWGARLFLLSCTAVAAAGFSGAVYDARELTADPVLLRWAMGINIVASNLVSVGMLTVFLCQPRRLVPSWVLAAIIGAAVSAGLANALALVPLSFFYLGLVVSTLAGVGVIIAQWLMAKGDPAARASLQWVGLMTLLGTGFLTLGMAAPALLHLPSLGGDGMSIFPLLAVYAGIAFGVGRYRLFELDQWSARLLLGAGATLVLLGLDAVLVAGIGLGGRLSLALSILAVGYLYIPARALIWRWINGRRALSDTELFQAAAEVAFAAPEVRRARWRELLRRLFDPLELVTGAPVEAAGLVEDGIALAVPATAEDEPLVLRYRDKGRRLFGPPQAALMNEVASLMRKAESLRDGYERGVQDERRRIARDLHDDVSARLLTSLSRKDAASVQSDVKAAMGEIRAIINSLTGRQVAVDDALADLRHETGERLRAAGIGLDWPMSAEPVSGDLAYRTYRHLASSVREAVSNVIKHSGASRLVVDVVSAGPWLDVALQDDGRGVAPDSQAGNGLQNMRSRMEAVGGAFDMPSTPAGTRIEMRAPLA